MWNVIEFGFHESYTFFMVKSVLGQKAINMYFWQPDSISQESNNSNTPIS